MRGIGIESIARGTLPLAVFGGDRYASIMGRIAMPSHIVQAASPSLGAVLLDNYGADATLAVVFVIALANVALVAVLYMRLRRDWRRNGEFGISMPSRRARFIRSLAASGAGSA